MIYVSANIWGTFTYYELCSPTPDLAFAITIFINATVERLLHSGAWLFLIFISLISAAKDFSRHRSECVSLQSLSQPTIVVIFAEIIKINCF